MLPDISVVICAYTQARWQALLAAIESIRRQSLQPRELILVFDHNPRLAELARRTLTDVVVIENLEPPGLSGARNSGLAAARGKVIAFLDDDARAEPDWLQRLSAAYRDSRVMGAGGAVLPQWAAGRPAWFPVEFDWVVGCTYEGLPELAAPVRNLVGANMSLRSDVFAGVGGFSTSLGRVEALPAGCEETELCIRAGQRWPDGVIVYDPAARVTHLVPAERARWSYFCTRCFAEGRSKAIVARLVGAASGLASERAYLRRALPAGVARGLRDTLRRGDWSGLARAAAIMAGTGITALGYLTGWLVWRRRTTLAAEPQAGVLL